MTTDQTRHAAPHTTGRVLHSATLYDLFVALYLHGRERAFRERLLALAPLRAGETVVDIGCGTGTLTIAARRHVGASGRVVGIDASPEMIARAARKAARAGDAVEFRVAAVEALPMPSASVDVVLSTLMFHHLPRPAREACVREIRRVLKPGGRVLIVDFGAPDAERKGLLARLHRHGHVDPRGVVDVVSQAGLVVTGSGAVGTKNPHYVLATAR